MSETSRQMSMFYQTAGELHVVALSGGKDSTAMALLLKEREPRQYTYVITPTGNELPEMYAHWGRLRTMLGGEFVPLVADTLVGKIEKRQALPSWRMRWCTRELKIEPYANWLAIQTQKFERVVSYVGIRYDEPEREAGDYSDIPGVEMRFPLREWQMGMDDVIATNAAAGVVIPERTDCALCFFQRLSEWYVLWKTHPDEWAEGERLEAATGHTFRSPSRDTWPASMAGLRAEFENGRQPRGLAKDDNLAAARCRVCRM